MKILALDIGTKRIGVAKANTIISIAMPLTTINRTDENDLINAIAELIKANETDKLLLGLPITLSGREEHSAKSVRKLGTIIEEKLNIEVLYWDERLSSVSAERILIEGGVSRQGRKGKVDKIAATIFLQNYLDYLKNKG
jgi:putative Holliday junction resolvase